MLKKEKHSVACSFTKQKRLVSRLVSRGSVTLGLKPDKDGRKGGREGEEEKERWL